MPAQALKSNNERGFGGALSGMTLADLLQIKQVNSFTGCLWVDHRSDNGRIFFRDGEVIHAEVGELSGREAFYCIMRWPGGQFRTQPKVTTTSHSIHENLTFLLLEAHRLQDEAVVTATATSSHYKESPSMSDINSKLTTAIPEVEYAVLLTKDGNAVDDTSYEGGNYAANALFLSLFAGRLGHQLGTGELVSAAVHGTDHHLLLFQSKSHYLTVTVSGASQLGAVEANVRKRLAQK